MASTSTNLINPSGPTPMHGEKLEKFNGNDFKRWQQKIFFYLTTLNLARFLTEDAPKLEEGQEADKEKVVAIDAWKHFDFLCRNYILNGLNNTLYTIYSALDTTKALWKSLDKKYKTKDASLKKFIVGRFLDFKMLDSKSVVSQVEELQLVVHEIHAEGMSLNEYFQVAAFIEKLPPSWKDFKNYLKHKHKEMSLEDLIVRLRIEDNKIFEKKLGNNPVVSKANIVEDGLKPKKHKHSNEGLFKQGHNRGPSKGQKFRGKCYNCGKLGHRAKECKKPKNLKKKKTKANMVDNTTDKMDSMSLSVVVMQCNLVGNTKEWWVDTGATKHVCANK
ncbi:hypothetical protein QN277_011866 [Acacia crassicarpa]|uniref:CCHC-type domain-containing protein n=1 Tax=Acacia crassicarpa TaxID=499986 RepID=A0AAE1TCT8_9FABA|nr:hypothetical protein QN277_011866 [Acacia crassicarpa]